MADRIEAKLYKPAIGGLVGLGEEAAKVADVFQREFQALEQVIEGLRQEILGLRILKGEPVMFAWGIATTDGAGGVTTVAAYGCRLSIAGTTIRMTFATPRKNDKYITGCTPMGSFARMGVAPGIPPAPLSKTGEFVDHRLYDDTGAAVSASTVAFSAMYWASGPRL